MNDEVVFEVHEAEEGGYHAVAQGHDIITQGDSWEVLKLMAQDAVLCHFDDHGRRDSHEFYWAGMEPGRR